MKKRPMIWVQVFIVLLLLTFALALAFCTNNETRVTNEEQSTGIEMFIRNLGLQKSHTAVPVPILSLGKPLYNGLFVMHATGSSLFELARLSLELKTGFAKVGHAIGAYRFRNTFDVITSSNPNTPIEFVKLLAKKHGFYVTKDELATQVCTSNFEDWKVCDLDRSDTCTSQLIFDELYKFCHLEEFPDTIYYVTSAQREDEVREAYQNDTTFIATTVTGIIHACVLKAMFPKMRIVLNQTSAIVSENGALFDKASEFFRLHF